MDDVMKIVTANRLLDGAVVYLGPDNQWGTELAEAGIAATEDQETAFMLEAKAAILARKVVGAYLMPVTRDAEERLLPTSWRERIRAFGPSVGGSTVVRTSGPAA